MFPCTHTKAGNRVIQIQNIYKLLPLISHYGDVIMDAIVSQITSLTIVYSTVCSAADQRKHQSSESLAFVWGIHRGQVNSPHKWPVTRKMSPFDNVIMLLPVTPAHQQTKEEPRFSCYLRVYGEPRNNWPQAEHIPVTRHALKFTRCVLKCFEKSSKYISIFSSSLK